jgi:hypothetical protein
MTETKWWSQFKKFEQFLRKVLNSNNFLARKFSFIKLVIKIIYIMDNLETNFPKINIDNLLSSIKAISLGEVAEELKLAVKLLRKYKLYESAKW